MTTQGFRLIQGEYKPIAGTQRADGTLLVGSDVLVLELHLNLEAPLQEALRFG